MQVVRAIGGHAPLHLTSNGKLFLAADDPQNVRSYAMRTGLSGNTHNSLTQLPQLERELAKARQTGIAYDNEELNWACAAWPPGFTMTKANWWPPYRFLPRQTAWMTAGSSSKAAPTTYRLP